MTSLRNRFAFLCLSIVGTAGLISFSNPAFASSTDDVRVAVISTADLNLAADAGRLTFERRVAAAARSVCSQPRGARLAVADGSACRREAQYRARREAGLAALAVD